MKNFHRSLRPARIYPALIIVAVISLLGVLASHSSATAPALTISVVNNSEKEIRHLFLAAAASDNWGDDQLSEAITAGTSRSINADWSDSSVKVVAEDEDGCFLTATLDTAGTTTWTITNSTPRNCGN